jgi:lipopolysaccharide biosynthesis glycosyltransferase
MNKEKKKNGFFLTEKDKLLITNYSLFQKSNKLKFKYFKYIKIKILLFIIVFFFVTFNKSRFIYHNLNYINIAMSLNDNYIYIIMVSITSILLNSNNNTFIQFHLLIGNDVKIENQNKITSLKRLNHNSNFTFYNVGNIFNGWKHMRKGITVATFYRSIVGELIKNVDKIIYLDGDTLTYGDLSEMYQLNMQNLYFRGIKEIVRNKYLGEGKDVSKFICAGVMLINLKLIREDHLFDTFKNYYLKFYNKKIYYDDQYIINVLFINKINFLPPKFGIWFMTQQYIKKYESLKPLIYSRDDLINANNKPIIRHLWGTTKEGFYLARKPWNLNKDCQIKKDWQYYANKTGYYSSICEIYKTVCN